MAIQDRSWAATKYSAGGEVTEDVPQYGAVSYHNEPKDPPRFDKGGVVKKALKKASEALGEHEGKWLNITQSDRTKVGGDYLGGPGFSSLQLERPEYEGIAWGVGNPAVAKTIANANARYPEGQAIWTTMLGDVYQHRSNQHVFDEIYKNFKKSAKAGNLDPILHAKINERLRQAVDKDGIPLFPEDVDILSKNFKDFADRFDKRAVAADVMGGVGVGGKKGQIFDYDKVIHSAVDPSTRVVNPETRKLEDVPTGSLGNRLFTLTGETSERPDLHSAFPNVLHGEDLGVSYTPAPRELVMQKFIEDFKNKTGRLPGYLDWTRGYAPSTQLTEELLTNMQKQGYAKGGMVETPPKEGGLSYKDYPNPYGLRAYKNKNGSYGGEMLPKYSGWLGLLEGKGKEKGKVVSEYSLDDEHGSFPSVVPTLDEYERELVAKGIVTPEIYKKAVEWRDYMQSQGESPFLNPPNYAKGGKVSLEDEFKKADVIDMTGFRRDPVEVATKRAINQESPRQTFARLVKQAAMTPINVGRALGEEAGKQIGEEYQYAKDVGGKQYLRDAIRNLAADLSGQLEESDLGATALRIARGEKPMREKILEGHKELPATTLAAEAFSPTAVTKGPKAIAKLAKELEGMPAGMSVKPVGGQWSDTARTKIEDKLREVTPNEHVSNWLATTGRKYILNRMGTPEDEVRKLLDQDISHIEPQKLSEMGRDINQNDKEFIRAKRRIAGFPSEGLADTAAGKRWELMTDEFIHPNPASVYQDKRFISEAPWAEKLDPETQIYSGERGVNYLIDQSGMPEIAKALDRSLKEGTLKSEQLNKVSMEDAVKLAHGYRVKDETELAKDLPKVVDYPEAGMAWHEITHEDPEMLRKILKREGESMQNCIGNYCEEVADKSTRLFSLRDKSGKPHVNIEVRNPRDKVINDLADVGHDSKKLKELSNDALLRLYEIDFPRGAAILNAKEDLMVPIVKQIKGKQNEAPVQEYIPYVQDFIKKSGPYNEIRDMGNAGLIDLRRAKEHGVFEEDNPAVNRELNRLFPAEMSRFGSAVLSGQHGVRISPDQMMKEALKGMEGDYVSTDEIVNYLQSMEPRPVEHGYSKYWKSLEEGDNHKKGGKITPSSLEQEFNLNRYMR